MLFRPILLIIFCNSGCQAEWSVQLNNEGVLCYDIKKRSLDNIPFTGKSVGYEAVQRRMEKSGEAIRNGKLKERTRKIVATAMQTARSRKELEQQLKKQGIDVVFRQNDSGRIYGVTFIDHDSRVVLNGSRLGKEYSANVFNERFSGKTGNIHQSEVEIQQREQSTHQEQPGFTPKADIVPGVASVLGAFGGLLGGGASGGDEPQDTARQKRKKKKKRTRRID